MKQQRDTKQKALILETVKTHHDHPTADQIYLEVRSVDERISRGTVYRNLNLLANNGELTHVKVPGADRFDYRLDPHYHLICTNCRTVSDVPAPYNEKLDQALEQKTGFLIDKHLTVFEGLCPACRKTI